MASSSSCAAAQLPPADSRLKESSMLTFTWLAIVLLAMLALAYRQCVRAWRGALRLAAALARGLGRALAAPAGGCSSLAVPFVLLAIAAQLPRRCAASSSATSCSPRFARCCRRCRRPSARRSRPAPSGGTASSSRARPTGASCSTRRHPRSPPTSSTSSTTRREELCAMVTDWETTNVYRDLPPARLAVHQGQAASSA